MTQASGAQHRTQPHAAKQFGEGMAGPALGYLMVNLPIAIASTLHNTITTATLGLQLRVVGTAASKDI
jgi:hypothetical protein